MKDTQLRRFAACPTGKVRYATERRAQKALLDAKIANAVHGDHTRREQRSYRCQHCPGYHLTSRPEPTSPPVAAEAAKHNPPPPGEPTNPRSTTTPQGAS